MVLGRISFSTPPVLAEWVWSGNLRRDLRSEALIARRNLLLGALHAGHGIGAEFEIHVVSGPTPELSLTCTSGEAARWVARVLIPAFGRSSWTRVAPFARTSWEQREWGRRVRSWPERFRDVGDGLPAGSHLLLAMATLPVGIRLRWAFSPSSAAWKGAPAVRDRAAEGRPLGSGGGRSGLPSPKPSPDLRPHDASRPLFWTSIAELQFPPAVAGEPHVRARARAAVEGALRSGQANGIRFSSRRRRFGFRPWFEISEDELLLIWPDTEVPGGSSPRWPGGASQVLPLGRSEAGAVVGPPIEPGQGRHVAILGETGMGKSAAIVALGHTAKGIGGVILFDPLGETALGFIRGLTPEERRERLRWVSPSRGSGGINALVGLTGPTVDPVLADRRLNDLVHALRRVRSERYDARYWGPRIEEMLTRALAAAAVLPDGTLADAHALLAGGGRSRRVVPPEAQEAVRSLVERIRDRPDDAEGARRLLYEVVRSPVLRRMLSDREPRLHAAELVAPGRLAVISGDASVVGESAARYLLAVHLALIWSELLARPVPSKTFVLLDESQWFAHDSLAEMLRLARRRNVHVILATQTVSSLPEEVREAVWTNVSDFVAFRGSPEEARELSRATSRVSAEEILSLSRGHAAVLLGKGHSVAWVRAVGRPSGPEAGGTESESPPTPSTSERPKIDRAFDHSHADPETVLEWLRARARATTGEGPMQVTLSELRAAVDPDGHAIRAAGALLGRTGALLQTSHPESGSVWTLDPGRLPPGPPAKTSATTCGGAQETQPS